MEIINGYKVHPAASQFPLLEGNAFHDLVSSIEEFGILHPIVLKDGMLIDGRNRLRAATKLNNQYKEENRSHRIKINSIELPSNVENVADYIFNININRRHLTPDQRVAIAEAIYPMIAEEQKTKQEATQFKPGNKANPEGKNQRTAETESSPPSTRDIKKKDEQSTVGQIAKLAEVSHHKARQVVAVVKAVEAGELPKDTIDKVKEGKVKLKDVLPKSTPKPKPIAAQDDKEPDLDKELDFYHITQKIEQYIKKYPPMQSVKNQIIAYLKTKKGNE